MTSPSDTASRLCVGRFAGAQGVRGLVRLQSFTADPKDIMRYRPLFDEQGRELRLASGGQAPKGAKGDVLVLKVEGVADRDAAQALNGLRVYVDRASLPQLEDEEDFYHADLIGCSCVTEEGETLGLVRAVHDFGAGDVLDVAGGARGSLLLPFTKAVVPTVSIAERRLTVRLPVEVAGEPGRDRADTDSEDAA